MDERHDNEQYFFDRATVDDVADLLEPFERPCVVCAPTVGVEMECRGTNVVTLDIDRRFESLQGFRYWNLQRPERQADRFGVIFCDPPFFNVSLSQLFRALRLLADFDFARPLALTYLARRKEAVLATFAPFGVQVVPFEMSYPSVKKCSKNDIVLFANFESPLFKARNVKCAHRGSASC